VKMSATGGTGELGGGVDLKFTPSGIGTQLNAGWGIGAGATITAFGGVE
jgi:hypothetical protein